MDCVINKIRCGADFAGMKLNALHRELDEVVDESDFFLHERLGVADAGEQAVVAGGGEHALADVFFGDEEAGAGGLVAVLRAVGEQRLLAGFDVRRDVDDEGGADVGVERGVEDLVGAVRGAWAYRRESRRERPAMKQAS